MNEQREVTNQIIVLAVVAIITLLSMTTCMMKRQSLIAACVTAGRSAEDCRAIY